MSLCPDCNSDTLLTDIGGNVWVLGIVHDGTCPTLNTIIQTNRKATS
jgi:hypothetical protein